MFSKSTNPPSINNRVADSEGPQRHVFWFGLFLNLRSLAVAAGYLHLQTRVVGSSADAAESAAPLPRLGEARSEQELSLHSSIVLLASQFPAVVQPSAFAFARELRGEP